MKKVSYWKYFNHYLFTTTRYVLERLQSSEENTFFFITKLKRESMKIDSDWNYLLLLDLNTAWCVLKHYLLYLKRILGKLSEYWIEKMWNKISDWIYSNNLLLTTMWYGGGCWLNCSVHCFWRISKCWKEKPGTRFWIEYIYKPSAFKHRLIWMKILDKLISVYSLFIFNVENRER